MLLVFHFYTLQLYTFNFASAKLLMVIIFTMRASEATCFGGVFVCLST